jgi:hypothetical protein
MPQKHGKARLKHCFKHAIRIYKLKLGNTPYQYGKSNISEAFAASLFRATVPVKCQKVLTKCDTCKTRQ